MMQPGVPNVNWNEIQWLSWGEFKQMAPSILQLEITRLGKLIEECEPDTVFHNNLVHTRFALKQFIDCLGSAKKDTFADTCAGYLSAAIAGMSFALQELDDETAKTCAYVLDRLNYVYYRIGLIY